MVMEDSHLSQMVNWLDEEHRKSKAELLSLQQRAEGQETELADQDRRLKALEVQKAGLQAQLARFQQLEQALEQLKSEVVLLISKSEERQRQAEREAERIRQIEQENQARVISEFKKDLEKLRQIEDNVAMLRAEDRRLGETTQRIQQEAMELRKQIEVPTRSVTFLEEQRRHDARRITELQAQTTESLKRNEEHGAKLLLLEELSKRNEKQAADSQRLINDLKQEQAHILENVQLREQARQRQMADWEQEIGAQKREMEEYRARMQLYAEQHERSRKAFDTLQEFKDRLERAQHQVSELQRLAEERQRAQMEEWQREEEKARQTQQLRWEQQWAEHIRQTEAQEKLLVQLHEQVKEQGRLIALLLQMQEELAQHHVSTAREWQVRFEELAE
jgi:hypothetical protein